MIRLHVWYARHAALIFKTHIHFSVVAIIGLVGHITLCILVCLVSVIFLTVFNAIHWSRMATAARVLHSRMADCLMHAPMSFFDTTPTGRVLNRVSYDVETVDTTLPLIIRDWLVSSGMLSFSYLPHSLSHTT